MLVQKLLQINKLHPTSLTRAVSIPFKRKHVKLKEVENIYILQEQTSCRQPRTASTKT